MYRWALRYVAIVRVRLMFLMVRLLPLASPKHDALGICAYLALVDGKELASAREQLTLSIGLIAHYEPRRYARLKADLRGILVHPFATGSRARYSRSTGLCELSPSLAVSDDIVTIASSIVHEGTHARLRRVRTDDPERRLRAERLCISQQIAFLEKLPHMTDRAAELRALLTELKPEDYTNEAVWADLLGEWKPATDAWLRARDTE